MMPINATHPGIVTLNLFQGPSCLHAMERAVARLLACGKSGASRRVTALADKWTLKRVQGDEIGGGVK